MKLHVELVFNLDPPITDVEGFHAWGDRLMDELEKLEACNGDVLDPSVSTEADNGNMIVELLVTDATHALTAAQKALDVIRAAMHAAGFGTSGWPSADEMLPIAIEASPVDTRALQPA